MVALAQTASSYCSRMSLQAARRYLEFTTVVLDASDDDMLLSADVERCRGVFAVSGDDSKNLVISLSAVSSIRRCASSRECTIHAMPRKPDVPVPTRVGEGGRRRRRVETIFPG
jgi:hypothetical protein